MTRLAASVWVTAGGQGIQRALAEATRASDAGADMVEYRLDEVPGDLDGVLGLVEQSPLPCIATCRPVWEGGKFDGDESVRRALFEALAGADRPPTYLDVELRAYQEHEAMRRTVDGIVERAGEDGSPRIILSSHDFKGRPTDLLRRVAAMNQIDATRVVKLAWRARSLRDNLEAFELLATRGKPTIALCMGEFGLPSRVLAKKFGGLLTFAALDHDKTTAPGQPTVAELKNLYRWDALDSQTRVYGVIGYPVGHSMSPAIHNAAFDAESINAVYIPMPVAPGWEPFKATLATWLDFAPLHFRGASVTIPHKEHLLRYVREAGGEVEELATKIGAANTLTVRKDGRLYACNTDYAAALDAVSRALQIDPNDLVRRKVGVLGAGGAARAVVAGFAAYGARVTVFNRTPQRAEELATAFNGTGGRAGRVQAAGLDALSLAEADIWINCTPVGMHPNTDATPMPWEDKGGPHVAAFDTIYNPVRTRWLREAEAAGCITVSGVEMFVRQAAAQFELWTGQAAPVDVMRRVVAERLHRAS